jgi:Fic family protein
MGISADGAWLDWILFFLRGVAEQARDAVARAKRLQDVQATWRDRLTQARSSTLLLRLADSLFESLIMTIPDAQRRLEVTYHSARRYMDRLVAAGIPSKWTRPPMARRMWPPRFCGSSATRNHRQRMDRRIVLLGEKVQF